MDLRRARGQLVVCARGKEPRNSRMVRRESRKHGESSCPGMKDSASRGRLPVGQKGKMPAEQRGILPVRIVLVRPQGGGNIGSVARVMRNFGLSDLAVVSPRAEVLGEEARAMACAARDVLEAARIVPDFGLAVAGCGWVCGTTARVGERRRAEFTPRTAGRHVVSRMSRSTSAIVFGPEDAGLSGEDLDRCHGVLSIPTEPGLASLNLAQAVGVVAYELWMAHLEESASRAAEGKGRGRPDRADRVAARAEELEGALTHLEETLEAIGFFRQTAPEHPMRELRRFLARSNPTRYELAMLRGICRKTLNALRHAAKAPGGKGEN